jgi:RNA polymerase subunit RPABC4/transcription elongation factor Spt4
MVCKACGAPITNGGICNVCGQPTDASADTQPNGPDALAVATMTAPEPTPRPVTHPLHPARGNDPAATNPGSGVFCGRCGSAVAEDGDFCGICGNPLRDAAVERIRHQRIRGASGSAALLDADAAATLPPLHAPRTLNSARWLGLVVVGALIVGLAFIMLIVQRH